MDINICPKCGRKFLSNVKYCGACKISFYKSEYDSQGYNKLGFNKYGYDREGYDSKGYSRQGLDREGYGRDGYNQEGYNKYGFNKEGYDREGYGRDGYNQEGYDRRGFDKNSFDRRGFHKHTGTYYNIEGYNRQNHDKEGYDREGFNKEGYDRHGYDRNGYDKEGFDRQDHDKEGYDREGFNKYGYDKRGFGRDGYNKEGYDREGHDKEGFNKYGYDKRGFGRDGYNKDGFHKEGYNGEGYDKNGFRRNGFNKDGYDREGFNKYGFNREGYDRNGYDLRGFNGRGIYKGTKTPYDGDGFDRNGYDKDGYTRNGFNKDGYTKKDYDKDGKLKITNNSNEVKNIKKDSNQNKSTRRNTLKDSKKKLSDSFDSLYYQSSLYSSNHSIIHYFIDYYIPKNRGESQDIFSLNILNFKRDSPQAVREFTNIVNSIISIENLTTKYVIPIPSSTKDKISASLIELGSEIAKKNGMKYLEALNRYTSVKSSHLAQGDRPTYQDHYNSIKCVKSLGSEKVLLLDDVYTLGSTALACIDKLIQNGSRDIVLITLGKTIGHEDNALQKYPITQEYDKQLGIPKNIKGIIFDLDGTLVDSSMLKSLRDNYKWKEARENVHQIIEFEGVSEILSDLKKKYKLGLVTSSPEVYASSIVKMMNWNFNAYVFYHDTQNHKPHPEPLIECAKKLGLKSEDCLAIGDEIIDIQAARKAGMKDAAAIWGSSERNKLIDFKPLLIYEYPKDLIGKRQG